MLLKLLVLLEKLSYKGRESEGGESCPDCGVIEAERMTGRANEMA